MQHRFFVRTPARRIALFLIFALSLSGFALSSFGAFAQDEKQDKKNEDRKKEKAKKSQEEKVKSVYKRWKDEDVRWIITDEERKIFDSLKTDDEREQFIEGFWYRRDPDPDTDVNEYREEYYTRIAYANEHYTSGIPGWKTDRGRIYIMFGKADQIETHPSGGSYDRPAWEGGGTTSTRSEEHTSELQSRENLVCRILLDKKKKKTNRVNSPQYNKIRQARKIHAGTK